MVDEARNPDPLSRSLCKTSQEKKNGNNYGHLTGEYFELKEEIETLIKIEKMRRCVKNKDRHGCQQQEPIEPKSPRVDQIGTAKPKSVDISLIKNDYTISRGSCLVRITNHSRMAYSWAFRNDAEARSKMTYTYKKNDLG